MFWLKACPRCGGDLAEERDIYGRFIHCLQCAHELNPREEAALRGLEPVPAGRRAAQTAPDRAVKAARTA